MKRYIFSFPINTVDCFSDQHEILRKLEMVNPICFGDHDNTIIWHASGSEEQLVMLVLKYGVKNIHQVPQHSAQLATKQMAK